MRGTSLLIYGGFTVIFNLFSVFMSYDFMRRFIGLFERKKMLTAILFFLEELTLVFVSCMSYPTYKAIALVVCNSLLALFLYRKPSKMVFYYVLLFSVVIALLECLLYYVYNHFFKFNHARKSLAKWITHFIKFSNLFCHLPIICKPCGKRYCRCDKGRSYF